MTVTRSDVFLYDVATREMVDAELWDSITEQQLTDYEGEWLPELFKALQRLKRPRSSAGALAAEPALGLASQDASAPGHARQSLIQCRLQGRHTGHDVC